MSIPANKPKYALVIEDLIKRDYNAVFTFSDDRLWQWLQRPERFDDYQSRKTVDVPGITDGWAEVTIGSAANDKALELTEHPLVTDVEDEKGFYATVARLQDELGEEHIAWALWC